MDIEKVLAQFLKWQLTGSTVIDPQGEHNDVDYICLFIPGEGTLYPNLKDFEKLSEGNSEKYIGQVYRTCNDCHGIDLTVTQDEDHYNKIVLATDVCTKLCLTNRDDRIMIFHAVAYGTRAGSIEGLIMGSIAKSLPSLTRPT